MWKFQDFSVIQILREINFGESRSYQTAVFALFWIPNFDFHEFLHFLDAEIYQINIIQSPTNGKNSSFTTSTLSKIDFT